MCKPIFVIGKHRSGTKWLSNILGRHSRVACVQRKGAGGIVEANVLSNYPAVFGSLRDKENYCAMASCFARDNFFRCTGLDERVLFARHIDDYHAFFRYVMDAYAGQCGASHWLQKAGAVALPGLYQAFADAHFVLITRNAVDNIRSSVALTELQGTGRRHILRELAVYHLSDKIMRRYANRSNVMAITFEDLKTDRERATRNVCAFLGLAFEDDMLKDRFEKNTSFPNGTNRTRTLTPFARCGIACGGPLLRSMPLAGLQICRRLFAGAGNPNASKFIYKTFSMVRSDYEWSKEE